MMDKLKMESKNNVQANIEKIKTLFPNAVTEVMRDGKVELAVDFDVLKQEMSDILIDDREERYQFTWPDKRKSILLANTPIRATLRPCKKESVNFDTTENLYIEGDNLDVLKLLQETYLGKVKMIYIDPPYNTGNDFVYNDDFDMSAEDYVEVSGQYDEQGNRLFQNTESNGRFHTDWLNMLYPRLKVAKDLLSDDGVIFISIDDNEVDNLRKTCDEIFGERNFVTQFLWTKTATPPSLSNKCRKTVEYVVCYEKNISNMRYFGSNLSGGDAPLLNTGNPYKELQFSTNTVQFNFIKNGVIPAGVYEKINLLDNIVVADGLNSNAFRMGGEFKWSQPTLDSEVKNGTYFIIKTEKMSIRFQRPYDENNFKTPNNFLDIEIGKNQFVSTNEGAVKELNELGIGGFFDFPKPVSLIHYLIKMVATFDKKAIILDFFSGSATAAHAVMQLNAKDGGNRKFIMVQLPEKCDENSEAFKAGYKNICEIGKERIRRAGAKILAEFSGNRGKDAGYSADQLSIYSLTPTSYPLTPELDIGFRVLKLDSSNMKEVFYNPQDYSQSLLDSLEDNIKEDRTPLDLLFQVMLELGKPLSAKIEEKSVGGKKVFIVDENDLIACFDNNVSEEVVKEIAKLKPLYAVFRDSSLADDATNANFDQIFATYSPNTVRKVL